MRILLIGFLLLLSSADASAGIVLTVQTGRNFDQGSGVNFVNVFVRKEGNGVLEPNATSFTADFNVGAGKFAQTSVQNGVSAPTAPNVNTGEFGSTGFVGAGNLQTTSGFIFVDSDPKNAYLSLDFTSAFSFPTTDTLIARLAVDVTGLTVGTYGITVTDSAYNGGITPTITNGSFNITAVPEPSSMLLLSGLGIVAGGWYRIRRKNDSSTVKA